MSRTRHLCLLVVIISLLLLNKNLHSNKEVKDGDL